MSQHFLPSKFKAPINLETDKFHIFPLALNVATMDYEAVMSSRAELQGIFGQNSDWPKSNMTLQENMSDLKVHEYEFKTRKAFAYSVLNNTKTKCFGSIYIDPSRSKDYDCEVHFWIRSDSIKFEEQLFKIISDWMQSDWPFKNIAYPGRLISWENWEKQIKVV